jgi:uncharacterized protein YeaO (DUF488 family)
MSPTFRLKRVYDEPTPDDGYRVLVDRLWPRGITKERAAADVWLQDAAPSPSLRTEWHHNPDRFAEFADRYRTELDDNRAVDELLELDHPVVTLLFAARDGQVNHAAVLRDYLVEAEAGGRTRT